MTQVSVRASVPRGHTVRWTALWAVLLTVAGSAAVLTVVRPPNGERRLATTVVAGLVAIATGAALSSGLARRDRDLSVTLLAAAIAAWGVGQLLVARQLWLSLPVSFPTWGTTVSLLMAPLAVAGLLLAARGATSGVSLLRIALDALLLGSSGCLLVWRWVFADGPLGQPASTDVGEVAAVVLLTECVVVGLLLLLWLRDLDRGLALAAGGLVLYVVPDLLLLHQAVASDGHWIWSAAVVRCLAWPLIGAGVLSFSSRSAAGRRAASGGVSHQLRSSDARVTAATTLLSGVLLLASILTSVRSRVLDPVTVQIALVVLVVFGAREIVGGLQRQGLLRGLSQLAFHDPLTGLGNRRALTSRVDTLTSHGGVSVLTLDLDGFKEVNDILGHASGDALLVAVAASVRTCLPGDVEAFRIGGDEFAVFVPGPPDRAQMTAVRLLGAVRDAAGTVPGAGAVPVSASIGVAYLGSDVFTGLVESGVALRAAKEAGRDRVEFFDGPVAARHRRGLLVERRLRQAVARGDVVPHYQPVVDLQSRRVVGVEALARWDDEVLGRVGPEEFIAVAERSGLIAAVGAAVLRQSIRDLSSLGQHWPDTSPLRLGVNASVAQMRRPGYAESVLAVAAEFALASEQLIIEVTESLFVDVDDPAVRELRTLRAAGVHVAIDDFGSGYSSLAYLARMPADILKFDRALTAQLLTDQRSRAVLGSIVTLARSLPMDVVVEGVETEAVSDLVRRAGAMFGQGWLYGAAVPFAELPAAVDDLNARALLASPHEGLPQRF